jgi:putative flippase GtrA
MIRRQLGIFLLNGLLSVSIAYLIYWALVSGGILSINLANGFAYLAGMAYGFFANRRWAFQDSELITGNKIARYIALHTFTLFVNVSVNSIVFYFIRGVHGDMLIAFLVAISITTILNFIGLKYWVFSKKNLTTNTSNKRISLP